MIVVPNLHMYESTSQQGFPNQVKHMVLNSAAGTVLEVKGQGKLQGIRYSVVLLATLDLLYCHTVIALAQCQARGAAKL